MGNAVKHSLKYIVRALQARRASEVVLPTTRNISLAHRACIARGIILNDFGRQTVRCPSINHDRT